jgi:diguanylate cyclase (GGDEF)-like protein
MLVGHLALLMAVMAWTGGYVHRMRTRLRATNGDLKQALQKIERIATQDELTGLSNRRSFNETAAREKERSDRNGAPLCIAMVDADHFKRVNDRHGHATGDEVLRMLGRTLRTSLRETDAVGRYGGEEFVILMPETPGNNAVRTLERLRQKIRAAQVAGLDVNERITVSIGLACYRHGEDIMQCVARADAALYEAKRTGRDRIVCDEQPVERIPDRAEDVPTGEIAA